MNNHLIRLPIGMRTLKTVLAVLVSMLIVDAVGTTDSRLIFAMLGATAALQPTFRESLESCSAQVVGVLFGAVAGLFLRHLPLPPLVNCSIGITLSITLYNAFGIRFSPSMPIFMVVLLCTSPDIQAIPYAIGRIWDSAIGLGVGMLINMLVFPYDNSRQIRAAVKSLDSEVIAYLEELFDGDDVRPDAQSISRRVDYIACQLQIFSNQTLFFSRSRQSRELERFKLCQKKANQLLTHLNVLHHIGRPGALSVDSRRRLIENGAKIADAQQESEDLELSLVTNYHVSQILALRRELLDALEE